MLSRPKVVNLKVSVTTTKRGRKKLQDGIIALADTTREDGWVSKKGTSFYVFRRRDVPHVYIFYYQCHINVTGLKSWRDRDMVRVWLSRVLDVDQKMLRLKTDNITAHSKCPHQVDLKNFILCWDGHVKFNSQVFPGAVLRRSPPLPGCCLLFHSGAFVILGVQCIKDISAFSQLILEKCSQHMK